LVLSQATINYGTPIAADGTVGPPSTGYRFLYIEEILDNYDLLAKVSDF
jgi:hypothetical protein